jgi:small-conductance mechanosensitive channel
VIDTLLVLFRDCLVVFGGALLLAAVLRFGRIGVEALPLSRARRMLVARLSPLAAATLIAVYAVLAARWVLDSSDTREWIAFGIVLALVAATSWGALRDAVEGVYLRAARSFAVGDRVHIDGVVGRIHRLGARAVVVQTTEGELAIVPYRKVASTTIRREAFDEQSGFHVFRAPLPEAMPIPEVKRAIREAALLCHWSSPRRLPTVSVTDDGQLEITVFPVDPNHVTEIERVVREALDPGRAHS